MELHDLVNYEIDAEIGQGSFATVYLGHDKTTFAKVAIKSVNVSKLNKKLAENLASEITILKEINHPNIVKLHEIQKTEKYIYLIMEYCDGGDLAQYLRQHKLINEHLARALLAQLSSALKMLWENNLIHRDLKPQNLLLSKSENRLIMKLADFGFARYVEPSDLAETLCGSPLYMAPEILRYERYDAKADLWSLGTIAYEMIFGRPPFRAENHVHLLRVIEATDDSAIPFPTTVTVNTVRKRSADRPQVIGNRTVSTRVNIVFSDVGRDFLSKLLKKDPTKRIEFRDLFKHPFISSNVFEIDNIDVLRKQACAETKTAHSRKASRSSVKSMTSVDNQLFDVLRQSLNDENTLKQLFDENYDHPPTLTVTKNCLSLALIFERIVASEMNSALNLTSSRVINSELRRSKTHISLIILLHIVDLLEHSMSLTKTVILRVNQPSTHLVQIAKWISQKIDANFETYDNIRNSITPSNASTSLSRSSSGSLTLDDSSKCQIRIEEIIYQAACKFAKEGGIQELLDNQTEAQTSFKYAIILFNLLLNPIEIPPLTTKLAHMTPIPEEQHSAVFDFIDKIQNQLEA